MAVGLGFRVQGLQGVVLRVFLGQGHAEVESKSTVQPTVTNLGVSQN